MTSLKKPSASGCLWPSGTSDGVVRNIFLAHFSRKIFSENEAVGCVSRDNERINDFPYTCNFDHEWGVAQELLISSIGDFDDHCVVFVPDAAHLLDHAEWG